MSNAESNTNPVTVPEPSFNFELWKRGIAAHITYAPSTMTLEDMLRRYSAAVEELTAARTRQQQAIINNLHQTPQDKISPKKIIGAGVVLTEMQRPASEVVAEIFAEGLRHILECHGTRIGG